MKSYSFVKLEMSILASIDCIELNGNENKLP